MGRNDKHLADIKKTFDAEWVRMMRRKSKDDLIAELQKAKQEIRRLKKALKPEQLTIEQKNGPNSPSTISTKIQFIIKPQTTMRNLLLSLQQRIRDTEERHFRFVNECNPKEASIQWKRLLDLHEINNAIAMYITENPE